MRSRHVITTGAAADVATLRWTWAQEDSPDAALENLPAESFVADVTSWMQQRSVWTAHRDGRAAGMVCLTQHQRMPSPVARSGGIWGYLGHLYVLPAARGHGIGRALIETVLAEARRQEYAKVVLSPTELSIPLYRRCGFSDDHSLMLWRP